ncbi:MAG: alpha/beta fold hydrolase [Eudoraea sp.]|nr:alpha/beta fold hydrolase [Eudoraea sp.]MBT8300410.1 alpha/beta fold hydrolase [Maribacter sp.]NNK17689.1 alpha/beta fold hydrolase [Maribacter sp.]
MKFLLTAIISLLLLCSCNQKNTIIAETEGFLNIDSLKLYYSIRGSGDTLVILHGGPGLSHKYLKPQLDSLLASKFTLLYYDQRGSGWSEGEKDTLKLNMQTYVSDLENFRNHFGLTKLNLVGHSFGGLLGMHYGVKYPENLHSLVLIDTDAASYKLRTPYQIEMINSRLSDKQEAYLDSIEKTTGFIEFEPRTYDTYYKTFLTSYFANPIDTAKIHLGFDSISVPKISKTNSIVRKNLGSYDIHDQLPKIDCRTLIMQGTESVFSVEGAEAIQNKLKNSELYLFENCGHFEYIEAPNRFKQLIVNFYGVD